MYQDHRLSPQRPEFGKMLRNVESLGVSCELGLIQRHCLIEPMGLFRFGYTPVASLIRAFEANLEDVHIPRRLRAFVGGNQEYFVVHKDYGFEFHSNHFADRNTKPEVLKKVSVHFKFLARKLREELKNGEKLFVYRSESSTRSSEDAMRLSQAMTRFGRPVLLWVELTDDPSKFGTAEWTLPGRLITGYLDWFAKTDFAAAMSFDCWIKLVDAALALWEATPARCEVKLDTARQAKLAGDYVAAFQIWTDLLGRFPLRPEPYVEAATLLTDLQQRREAKTLVQLGLARMPSDSSLQLLHARLQNHA